MYRKTHFKPDKVLWNEISKEFAIYFARFGSRTRHICEKYPKQIFLIMLGSMLISGILAFTVMRVKKDEPAQLLTGTAAPITQSLGQILGAGQALKKVLDLQNEINIVLQKDTLTSADSLIVKNAIGQLEKIHRQLNVK
ncbi:hypothetical protein [Pedobacter helvus]|uniref:Uncharacterized protein n=1 Tax=Pedobacter helvus TaxID=2563444 RepID=A0ABW9JMC3_9SPHI|nr:hypothetical protein [Pedobacter ureilyticus]